MARATVALQSGFVVAEKSRIYDQSCACSPSLRPLCLGSTSRQQLSTCGIPLGSSLLGSRRGFVRGPELTRRSSQRGPRTDFESEERPIRAKENENVESLDELDSQLRSLSSLNNSMPVAKQASQGNVETAPEEEKKKVLWPVFGEGFMLYIGMALILITIINNILFKIFLGPPVPRSPPYQETQVPAEDSLRERYKLRSYKDPKYIRRFAPPVNDEPRS